MRWWPKDHAWCLGNDIYARSVFIGGTHTTIDALSDHPALETYAVTPHHIVRDEDY